MKVIPIQLLQSTTRALFLRVTRTDGQIYGFSTTDARVVIDGLSYGAGMDISTFQLTADLSVNNGEVTFLPDEEVVLLSDLLTGVWDKFSYDAFEADWTDPTYTNLITTGWSGVVNRGEDGKYTAELRGLKQALANAQGQTTSINCRARFADYPIPFKFNVLCTLNYLDYTDAGTITFSANRQSVTVSGISRPDQWFQYGFFVASTGDNGGQARQVRSFVGNVFIFDRPFDYDFAPGDLMEALAGCDKMRATCRDKFDNILNMQAEPDTPGVDAVSRAAYGNN